MILTNVRREKRKSQGAGCEALGEIKGYELTYKRFAITSTKPSPCECEKKLFR